MKFLENADRNEITYWIGLALLFVGLTIGVSVATALIVCGAAMAVESVLTSYLLAWMMKNQKAK